MKFALAHVGSRAEGLPDATKGLLDSVQDQEVTDSWEMNIHLSSVCVSGPSMCQVALWFGGRQGTEEAGPGGSSVRQGGAKAPWVSKHVAVCQVARVLRRRKPGRGSGGRDGHLVEGGQPERVRNCLVFTKH